jgi:hypothetical protein
MLRKVLQDFEQVALYHGSFFKLNGEGEVPDKRT